jgi:RNA polymerase sigma-70 factor (ECF subfamily)
MFKILFWQQQSFEIMIEKAQNYDKKWLEYIYDNFSDKIYKYIFRRVNNLEDAENITSIVWERICKYITKFNWNSKERFEAWIITISKNQISSYYSKNRIQSEWLEEYQDFKDENLTPDKVAINNSSQEYLLKILNKLPEKQSECIKLKYFDWYKNKEIANILWIKEPSVASNLNRGLEKIKLILENNY